MKMAMNVANRLVKLATETGEPITNIKLQKLLYYCFAWYLVEKENNEVLFVDKIEAWQYGPVVPNVYHEFKDFGADNISFEEEKLAARLQGVEFNETEAEVIEQTFFAYAHLSATKLVDLTHQETPWIKAFGKKGLENKEIDAEVIYNYFAEKKKIALAQVLEG